MKDTLRRYLTKFEFNWERGTIVYRDGKDNSRRLISSDDAVLDRQFDPSFGDAPQAPQIVARDDRAIYFCCQYDGSCWLERVMLDIDLYLNHECEMPYPGVS